MMLFPKRQHGSGDIVWPWTCFLLFVMQLVRLVSAGPVQGPAGGPRVAATAARPNIVFLMADDWSWPHAGILGDPAVQTPHFDRIAREGVLFENAFVSTPSCTPSRLSLLAGQHHWRLQEGDSLGGSLRERYPVFTELLQAAGYHIGRVGKGVWPSKHTFRKRDSFGPRFVSFDEFLQQRDGREPFCFWYGGRDPHRPYTFQIGEQGGISLSKVRVPACLPDQETVRRDLADYLWGVQRFDREIGDILTSLEATGELNKTIIVVSGDNGMPFPRCKATLYDQGIRVPLAVRWGTRVQGNRRVTDFVSLCDFAPTFLMAAGLNPPSEMTGRSLLPILFARESGQIDPERTIVLSGLERHVYAYPARAIRNKDYLYIRNFNVSQWPTGEVEGQEPVYDFRETSWPTGRGAFSFNIDPSPTKQFLRLHRSDPAIKRFADLSFGGRADEELYDLGEDSGQLRNVALDSNYSEARIQLRRQLDAELIKSKDPRLAVPGYQSRSVDGWPVRVSDILLQNSPELTREALDILGSQLQKVKNVLPPGAIAKLKSVPIWLSHEYEGVRPTGEYHPGTRWLKEQGRHPQLHRCIEFTNIRIFRREVKRMPMMVLHELAHAFHDQVLGFDHPSVKTEFDRAKTSGIYEQVLRGNGNTELAYGMTNHKEYFAESSEAFFGRNDFYPFNRSELVEHDPRMADLLSRLWGAE